MRDWLVGEGVTIAAMESEVAGAFGQFVVLLGQDGRDLRPTPGMVAVAKVRLLSPLGSGTTQSRPPARVSRIDVSVAPGSTAFTRTPRDTFASVHDLVNGMTAAFVALYTQHPEA
jgi:hypothetical protein